MPAVYLAVLLSASAFVLSVFSFFYFRSYLRRRTGQERILSELREEVSKILKSIDETTDRDISLIEEQERKLKSLLEEIDKRLKLYIREMEKGREAEDRHAALTYQDLVKNRYRAAGQDLPREAESAQVVNAATAEAAGTQPAPADPPPVREQILQLMREGFAPPVIASRLGLSIAQVEFTAALLERRNAQ